MGRIKVNTNLGPVFVNIRGDNPTDEEKELILSKIKELPQSDFTESPSTAEMDAFQKQRTSLKQEDKKEKEKDTLKDPEVDYTSGLQDLSIRLGFSNKELDSEKTAYLNDVIGEGGFRQDKGGRFIITKQGREKLNLGEGPELAIDEEGLSRYDVVDFVGEAGLPLGVGIVAGILTGGMGTLPAMAAVGGSMALGKLIDETIEYASGYQRQTKADIARDAAFEGAMGFLGEGAGRAVSSIMGRFIKGSASEAVEEGKVLGREMIKRGFQPTLEGAAPGAFSILGRAQAIYEGVIPNRTAAIANLSALKKELKDLGAKDDANLGNLVNTIRKDIDEIYGSPEERLATAQRVLGQEIEAEIKKIMTPLTQGRDLAPDLLRSLNDAKDSFQRQSDGIFKVSGDLLGDNNRIIPVGQVSRIFDTLAVDSTEVSRLLNPKRTVGSILAAAKKRATERVKATGTKATGRELRDLVEEEMYLTPIEAQKIRTAVSELSFNPQFISAISDKNLNDLSKAIDTSFVDAEGLLLNRIMKARAQPQLSGAFIGPREMNVEDLQKGLRYYQRARKYYAAGINRFKDTVVASFVRKANKEPGQRLDVKGILDHVIRSDQPEQLSRFLKSIKGVRVARTVDAEGTPFPREPQTVRFAGEDLSIPDAKAKLSQLEAAGVDTTILRQGITQAEKELSSRMAFDISSGTRGEAVRKQLAGEYISRLLNSESMTNLKNGVPVLDGIKLSRAIDNLGSTKNVLFRGELDELNDLTKLLRSTGAEIDRDAFEQFAGRPLVEAIKGVREAVANQKAVSKDALIQALGTGSGEDIMSKLFAKGNARVINEFMENNIKVGDRAFQLPQHLELKNAVQDAAMGRILRSLGDVNKQTFADDFMSGRLGTQLQKVLAKDYGEETITAMFGKEQSDNLFKLADIMKRASQQPMAGKGGLAPATIALGLTAFSFMAAPITTGSALLFYTSMSSLLRKPSVLKYVTASREPGADLASTVARDIQTAIQKTNLQAFTSPEGPLKTSPENQRSIRQATANILPTPTSVPNVNPTIGNIPATNVDPTNPIVNPDPATQALAQALSQRRPN